MNLVTFVENRYQEITLETKDAFNARKDSEIKALKWVLDFYREALKWLLVPAVITAFFLVKMKLMKEPRPVLLEQAKATKEAEAKAKLEAAEIVATTTKLIEEGKVSQIKAATSEEISVPAPQQ